MAEPYSDYAAGEIEDRLRLSGFISLLFLAYPHAEAQGQVSLRPERMAVNVKIAVGLPQR